MVELGKPRAIWAKTETGVDLWTERTIRFALRRDGSLVRNETVTYAKGGEHPDGGTAESPWELISEKEATPPLEEMHARMGASDFALISGDVPDPVSEPVPQPQTVEA